MSKGLTRAHHRGYNGQCKANFIVFPRIVGAVERFDSDADCNLRVGVIGDWRKVREYEAILRITGGYPFANSLNLVAQVTKPNSHYSLDFENAKHVSGRSFSEEYRLRNKQREALGQLLVVAREPLGRAVQDIIKSQDAGRLRPLSAKRFSVLFELESRISANSSANRTPDHRIGRGGSRRRGRDPIN